MKKILAFVCLFAMMLTLFSCSDKNKENVESTDSETVSDSEQVEDSLKIFKKSDVANFKIAYYSGLKDDTVVAVNELADKINSVCDSSIKVTSDFILSTDKYMKEWDYEILIGLTNREESTLFAQNMRINDYGYGYVDGKILICGKNDVAVKNAINSFILNVLIAHADEDVFYQSDWMLIENYSYLVESLTVNGSSVQEYEIIYPKDGTLFEEQMAMRLQSYLLDKTGYSLSVKNDGEAKSAEKAFLIGKTKYSPELISGTLSSAQGCVNSTGGDVVAWGNDMSGMVNACKKLTEMLIDETISSLNRTVTINSAVTVSPNSNFSVMDFNVYTADQTKERIERVTNVLLRYMPDSIGLQEVDEKWMKELKWALSDYYEIVGEGREGGSKGDAVPILYSKEKYNLIESGTKWLTSTPDEVSQMPGAQYHRNFTWALLEDKATGVRHLHLNTHLDTAGSDIRYEEVKILTQFLKDYNNVSVVLTGDMNSKLNSKELNLLKEFGLASVFDHKELTNVKSNANSIDWIYLTPDTMLMTYHTFDDSTYNGDYPSDHYPHYAEFSVTVSPDQKINHGWDVEVSDYPDSWIDVSEDHNESKYNTVISVVNPKEHVVIGDSISTIQLNGVNYLVIRSVEELNAANQQVLNGSATYNYILANDLDYTGKDFQRIKLSPSTFNGNGYSVYGFDMLETNAGGSDGLSMFLASGGSATNKVCNLTVGSPDKHITVSSERVGGTVGVLFPYINAVIEVDNVDVYANITTTNANVGGLIGFIRGTLKMTNCSFYGSITDTVGRPSGGLVGAIEAKSVLTDCANYGEVMGVANVAGIAATLNNGNVTFTNCINYGTLTGVTVGGIIGGVNVSNPVTFEKCLNAGSVFGTSTSTGGLVGWLGGSGEILFKNCANIGSVVGAKSVAGLIFYTEGSNLTLENCGSFGSLTHAEKRTSSTVISNMVTAPKSVTDLVVASISDDATDVSIAKTEKTMTEALAWVNSLLGNELETFVMNSDGKTIVKAQPEMAAIQQSSETGKAGSVRLVALLNDCLRYSTVGFELAGDGGSTSKYATAFVHREFSCSDGETEREISASAFGGTYVYAIEVEGIIPAEGTVTVTVTPFATDAESEVMYRGSSYEITFTDGVLVSVVESKI